MSGEARLFVGLELSGEARKALADACLALKNAGVVGNFYDASLFHITLCFLGATPRALIPRLGAVMNQVHAAPFSLTLGELGSFKRGTILWAGVKRCAALMDYQSRLADALREDGFPLAREEAYTPHITLIRKASPPLPAWDIAPVTFAARHVTLFESTRVDGRLTYLPLLRCSFSE